MSSPAEKFAQAARRRKFDSSHLGHFVETLPYPLDDFQSEAARTVQDGRSVLVAAPTGAGKSVVGEFACYLAVHTGRKAFYTTPIKALSNQKYADLVEMLGTENVGLLTGDTSHNSEAPVVVMTTEVLRNMLYAGSSTLGGLGFVVMDEVHYLADRFRGAVWEEVMIHLPESVQVIALSATVSNAEEFGDWMQQVRGDTDVVITEHRPVPLYQHMMVGARLYDLLGEDERGDRVVNPDLLSRIASLTAPARGGHRFDVGAPSGRRGRGRRPVPRQPQGETFRPAPRAEVIAALDRAGLLPAITFIFSRAGCEGAVAQLLGYGMQLVTDDESATIRAYVAERVAHIPVEDLAVIGYHDFVEGLARGFAAHHAGMLPTFREIVEELFVTGQIKAVFATETLALGINMPARSVVLERLVKYNGEAHVDVTPAEFTQLTGRAGRRGIDVEGHAIVLYNRGVEPEAVAGLASRRTYPLRSSFRPTFNMAVNLVHTVGRERAREVLESSFAQFQADRSVVGLSRQIAKNNEGLEGYAEAMQCHLGDFAEYAGIRRRISDLEKNAQKRRAAALRAAADRSLADLSPGDVVRVPSGRREGLAIVVRTNRGGKREGPSPSVVTEDAQLRQIRSSDIHAPLEVLTHLAIPKTFTARSSKSRRDLAATLRAKVPHDPPKPLRRTEIEPDKAVTAEIEELRRRLAAHPCHACEYREEHARWAQRWWTLRRETDALVTKVENRTNTVAKQFDRICDLLLEFDYLAADPSAAGGVKLTDDGAMLMRLYSDKDLLTAECLRSGAWKGLDAPSLAAAVSALVHESRRDVVGETPRMPNRDVADALERTHELWSVIDDALVMHRLPEMAAPDAGLAWAAHRWASGQGLETVLRDEDLTAGDFVRRCRQLVDVLDQIAAATDDDGIRRAARKAIKGVQRGVVAADRID
ncbi:MULTISPECIES: DEAD/DEAH box helicase [Dermacoccus]|uniref:DEAD/DEAH box helicase n=1 Tax=Dermacoccus TaxID=57495 RepID=UPI0001E642B3|nr:MULTISPECIES: DEAD/DEAH box helicase [Dermacoccus]EFP56811.1 DEAD/DEAH box helicase [Dermacoccus sp. Ellin185]